MSVEDDMIEYGFWDGNDYMDYLMNEADQVDNERKMGEAKAEENERWLESLSPEEMDELNAEEERKEKLRLGQINKEIQEKIGHEVELKQWIKDFPEEAKVWLLYDHSPISNYINYLGRDDKGFFWEGYTDWKNWKKRRQYYFKFKAEYPQEWDEWRRSFLISYLQGSIESFFSEEKVDVLYKWLCQWRNDNIFLWDNLRKVFVTSKSEEDYELQAWLNHCNWHNTYRVWKVIDKDIWEKEKKCWTIEPESEESWILYNWQKEHNRIWNDWKNVIKDSVNEWRTFLCNLDIFFSEKDDDVNLLLLYSIDEANFAEPYSDDEIIDFFKTLKIAYEGNVRDPQSIYGVLKNNKVEILKLYVDLREELVDRMEMCLWIEHHRQQWQKWKYKKMWHHCYKDRCPERYVSTKTPVVDIGSIILDRNLDYPPIIYFNTWKLLYPRKWEKWKTRNYDIWKQKAKELDIWKSWINNGNEWKFDEFASNNIEKWDIYKDNSLYDAMQSAYELCFGRGSNQRYIVSNSYKDLFENSPKQRSFLRSTIREWVLIEQFNFEVTKKDDYFLCEYASESEYENFIESIKHGSYTHRLAIGEVKIDLKLQTEIDEYIRLLALFSNYDLKCMTINEIIKWERLSYSIRCLFESIFNMGHNTEALLYSALESLEDVRLKKDLSMQLKLFMGVSHHSVFNGNAPSFINIYSEVIEGYYYKNEGRYGSYEYYQKAKGMIPKLESLYEEWIASRNSISRMLDNEKAMSYDIITKIMIESLCNLLPVEEH